jgi:hypothetical protein
VRSLLEDVGISDGVDWVAASEIRAAPQLVRAEVI